MTTEPPALPLFVLRWQFGNHLHAAVMRCGACARNEWIVLLLLTSTATLTVIRPDGTATELTAEFLE